MFDIHKSFLEREKIQSKAVELSKSNNSIRLLWCTGVGKTAGALKIIDASKSPLPWIICVPEIPLIENFKQDIVKHEFTNLLDSGKIKDIICHASIKKYEGQSVNIVMDEAHHASDLRSDILKTIKSDQRVFLSATLNWDVKQRLDDICDWIDYEVSLTEAIDKGILPEPIININNIVLDDVALNQPFKTKQKITMLTEKRYYEKLSDTVDYWKNKYDREGSPWQYKKMLFAAVTRKRWLANIKTRYAKAIINTVKNNRFICFCGSVTQARELGGKQSVHSKNTKEKNLEIIREFNAEKTTSLYACQMLREGHNLTNIERAIIIQIDSESLSLFQMLGRSLRSIEPVIDILIVKDTIDTKYFSKFLGEIPQKYIRQKYF
jgi:hypothetical protein